MQAGNKNFLMTNKNFIQESNDTGAGRYRVPDNLKKYIRQNSVISRSPGRINLIGEHTDYNNGFVLPAAIDKAADFVITPRYDHEIHVHSVFINKKYTTVIIELI